MVQIGIHIGKALPAHMFFMIQFTIGRAELYMALGGNFSPLNIKWHDDLRK
jgi:hypothetical protein